MCTPREEYPKPQMDMDYYHSGPYTGMDEGLRDEHHLLSLETLGNRTRSEPSGQICSMPAEARWHSGTR